MKQNKRAQSLLKKAGISLLVLAFWLLVWQMAYGKIGSDLLLSSPRSVAVRIGQLAVTSEFWLTIGRTFSRIMIGFFCALAGGILMGIITASVPVLDQLIRFPMNMIKSTPVASFVILALM